MYISFRRVVFLSNLAATLLLTASCEETDPLPRADELSLSEVQGGTLKFLDGATWTEVSEEPAEGSSLRTASFRNTHNLVGFRVSNLANGGKLFRGHGQYWSPRGNTLEKSTYYNLATHIRSYGRVETRVEPNIRRGSLAHYTPRDFYARTVVRKKVKGKWKVVRSLDKKWKGGGTSPEPRHINYTFSKHGYGEYLIRVQVGTEGVTKFHQAIFRYIR